MPPANYIDELVNAKLQKLRILPSEICGDRGLPAARDDRHHRRAAHRGRISGLPRRQVARQAGEARRSPAGAQGVRRNLGHEVGRAADGPLGRRDADQLQVDLSLFQLAHRADRRQRAAGPDRAATAGRPRRHVLDAGDELLPDRARHAEDGRERGPGLHGHARAVRPVPQPSVRPLDDGRLLQLRRLLQPDRPQGRRRLSRDDRLQPRRRRGEPSRRRPA